MNYERLEVWQRATNLAIEVFKYAKTFKDYGFKDQLTRSVLSIPSNIAEGMTRLGNKEKRHFLAIAKASSAELNTQVIIGSEIDYIERSIASNWKKEIYIISAMLSGLMKALDK
ncbi:four helix bundle protein [Thalassotalea agarivorans]|uniref:Four helix bundle protein n=1 Tax=Thalassotalea agarivorans TaxID=349064 RepID=A0A1H9YKJ8_THASX|nr:four helix bundle protein [Thalassotalea agarivorans]SES69490.1 four helix bundle protein [Thalassotalea agarivorans]